MNKGNFRIYFSNKNYEENAAFGFTLPALTLPEKYVCWFTESTTELKEPCTVTD